MSLLVAPQKQSPLSKLFSLEGKVCLVTGGNRGIGLAIVQGFAEAGAAAVAIIHSSAAQADAAAEAAETIHKKYPQTTIPVLRADVGQASEIEAATQKVFEQFGRLDVVVANAGVYTDTPALEMTPDEAQQITNVNYFGVLYTAQCAARIMKNNGGGRIIFTASINGHIVLRPQYGSIVRSVTSAAYCATKAAVVHLTRALAVEFAKFNIQVNSVSPGYVNTEMNDELIRKNPGQAENWLRDCPAGRFCEVWELKGIYVFLATAASSYITGSDYLVDGGHTCH